MWTFDKNIKTPVRLTLCQAIARQEGFYLMSSRAAKNNNPGNIEYSHFSIKHGALASDGRFAIFPDAKTGFNCMAALLLQNYKSFSVKQTIEKWAPSNENDTEQYIRNVCLWTGLSDNDIIDPYVLVTKADT